MNKERLCDTFYNGIIREINDRAYGTGKANAWVASWPYERRMGDGQQER